MAQHNVIGKVGEDIAARWLFKKNFTVIERNFLRKWGEIDIVARETSGSIHFVEVKSVSYETKALLEYAVAHETWRPEENVHPEKLKRLIRVISTWIDTNDYNGTWQIDIITVRIVPRERYAVIKLIDNIIVE